MSTASVERVEYIRTYCCFYILHNIKFQFRSLGLFVYNTSDYFFKELETNKHYNKLQLLRDIVSYLNWNRVFYVCMYV